MSNANWSATILFEPNDLNANYERERNIYKPKTVFFASIHGSIIRKHLEVY